VESIRKELRITIIFALKEPPCHSACPVVCVCVCVSVCVRVWVCGCVGVCMCVIERECVGKMEIESIRKDIHITVVLP